MQIERVYYDERWHEWKIDVNMGSTTYVLPLAAVIIFASRVLCHVATHLTTTAPDAAGQREPMSYEAKVMLAALIADGSLPRR